MRVFLIFFLAFNLLGCNFVGHKESRTELDFKRNLSKYCEWERVERIVDGDTLIIESNREKIRFIGIDTPETKHPRKPIQKFGIEASNKTKELLPPNQKVCLIQDRIGDKYDKYGRKLAYVFTESGQDVNALLLKSGLARGYYNFPFERKEAFRVYELEAQKLKKNIWE